MRELPRSAIHASPTAAAAQIGGAHHRRSLLIAGLAAVLMALTGAFETDELAVGPRRAYWLVVMLTGASIAIGVTTGVRSWGRLAHIPLAEGTLVSAAVAVPLTLAVSGATLAFFGGRAPSAAQLGTLFGLVFGVTAAVTAINYLAAGARRPHPHAVVVGPPRLPLAPPGEPLAPVPPEAPPVPQPPPRLAERLPAHLRAASIHALEAEDHYVRVHTDRGSTLLLVRMADAIAELDGLDGARTHRSWWVARSAVLGVTRADGRAELALPGGERAPVSRTQLPTLIARGWLDDVRER